MDRYAIIMAGGSGKRLWPLSRAIRPKQFMELNEAGTLLANTIKRLTAVFDRDHILVIGLADQQRLLEEHTKGLIAPGNLLLEPLGRNTAACIAYGIRHIKEKDREALISVFPADHFIGQTKVFEEILQRGMGAAKSRKAIVTLGVRPSRAAIEYGYIHVGENVENLAGVWYVRRFVEKPDAVRAAEFIREGTYLWNSGIFIFRLSVMEQCLKEFLPDLYRSVSAAYGAMKEHSEEQMKEWYRRAEKISIDDGVMEKYENILVISGDFGWSDVGSYQAIYDILPKDQAENAILKGQLLAANSSRLLVHSEKKLVVAVGVENLTIIDTPEVLYICNTREGENAKMIAEMLREREYGGEE